MTRNRFYFQSKILTTHGTIVILGIVSFYFTFINPQNAVAQSLPTKAAEPSPYRWYVTAEPGIAYHWHRVRPVVPEVFGGFSPVTYGKISFGYQMIPNWAVELAGQVIGYSPSADITRRPTSGFGTSWRLPITSGNLRLLYSGLTGKRFALHAFVEAGVSYLSEEGAPNNRGSIGPTIVNDQYLFIEDRATFVQPWIPYAGIGIRPEVRLTRKGRLWTYLSLSAQSGWREAAGLDLTYFTEPSHSQPNTATSRFSGSGWTLGWGWKVYLGNEKKL